MRVRCPTGDPRRAPGATLIRTVDKFKLMKNQFNLVKIKIEQTQSIEIISQGPTVTVKVSMFTRPPQFYQMRFLISKGNRQRFGVG